MRLVKEILQIPACAIGFAVLGGAISLVTAVACEEVGLVRHFSVREALQTWLQSLLLGATVGGLLGLVWSARRCVRLPVAVLETDDEVW